MAENVLLLIFIAVLLYDNHLLTSCQLYRLHTVYIATVSLIAMDGLQAIVIDSGSDTIKAGFAGDDEPRAVFPNLVATDETGCKSVGDDARWAFIKSVFV